MEEDSISFPHSIMSLPTLSLMLSQTSSGSNRLNENTALVKASDFENVNIQSENAKPDTESAQSPSGFVKEEVNDSFADFFTL